MDRPFDPLLARIRSALSGQPLVGLAVLFGSRAKGKATESSDVDIGILPRSGSMTLREELALASALCRSAEREVDLVRLDTDDLLLNREVATTGICLFEGVPGAFAAYRAEAISRWLDFDEAAAPHRARFLRKLSSA